MTALPQTMTAIVIDGKGGPEVLVPREVPVPQCGPGQVLIQVAAAGVNRPDVLQRKGLYPAPKGHSEIPGLEAAGTVVAVGDGVGGLRVGARVMALLNGGGYAQYALAEAPQCLPVPERLSLAEAGAVPETFFTVWHNVFERGGLKAGEWLLVHGGSSGIGVTAIAVATALGAKVIATAGSAEKVAACVALGAVRGIDYSREDFVDVMKETTAGHGADVILDMVGGDYVERNITAAAEDGRIVNIAYQKGGTVTVNLQRAMVKRLTLTGSTLRVRTTAVKGAIAAGLAAHVLPLLADGRVRVVMDQTFPLADAAEAHARMEAGAHIGKMVLIV